MKKNDFESFKDMESPVERLRFAPNLVDQAKSRFVQNAKDLGMDVSFTETHAYVFNSEGGFLIEIEKVIATGGKI